ncbi:hypothetical protein BKA59DRAFT_530668 [Fusarium tricinctum]|uniref:Nephrocystin 3-like N-terminal domain-containing protein n=1 Tax=Fusarium tricinctum TaxID=61284 RepID=A0A8K0WB29_9HYPO|nr:hypothetical protein BKA59DRAFT_530668 [Fusarium tricinctum]
MEAAASLITIVDLTISISSACVKYVREVSHAAEEACALHEELGSLLLVISRLQLPSVSSSMRIELEQDIKICHDDLSSLQAKLKPAKGFGKIRQSLVWPFKKSGEFKNTSIRIQRHLNIFEKAVTISTLEITADIKAELAELRRIRESDHNFMADKFDMIGEHVHNIKESINNVQRQKLLEWLNAVDCESNYRDNVSLAAPSTGSWFLEDAGYFAQWIRCGEGSPRNILIQAGSMSGFTVIMTRIAALAFSSLPSSNIYIGYYYFDFRNSQKSLPSSMLRSLLYQAITRMSTTLDVIEELRSNYPTSDMVPVSELVNILHQQYSSFDTAFLFIDALDECEKVDELLNVIRNLSRNIGTWVDVRFMCFGRDEGAIKRTLESSGFSSRPWEYTTVVQDIEAYVRETINNDASGKFQVFHNSPEGLRRDVSNTLVQQSEGMFRWVQCQLDEISRCRTARDIRDAINNLPPTLTETYKRIFERMSKSDLCKAQRILSWLIGTDGSMTTNMLVEALTIDEDRLDIDQEGRLGSPDEIRDICRSLVRESDHPYKYLWPDCKIITLAHFSVKQYLLSPEAREFRLDLRTIHLQLSRACLAYSTSTIWKPIEESAYERDTLSESSVEAVQFLAYTCGDIFSHLQYQNVEYELLPHIIGLLQQDVRLKNLQQNCELVSLWQSQRSYPFNMSLYINSKEGPRGNTVIQHLEDTLRISHTSSFLSKSVVAGLYPTYLSLIGQRIEFNTTDGHYQTPLAFIVATCRIGLIQRYIFGLRKQYQIAVSHSPGEAEAILESILKSTVNGAIKTLYLFHDYSASSKVYQMMIRLCATLDAAKGTGEALAYLRSHASSSGRMSAQALNQLEEEILYVSVCQLNAEHVQEFIASGASPSARINLPSNLRLLHQRYTDDITLENVNKYWTCYLDPEMLLNEVDTNSRDWEYSEEKPEFVITAGMHDPGIARLLIQGRHEKVLDIDEVLVKAVESWLLVVDTEEQIDDLEVLRSLLYEYLQKPENKQKINMALVICSGNIAGTQAVRQLLARGADPNCSILDENYRHASTPLVAACRCGSYDNVKLLLDAQADPNLESESGMIPSVAIFASSKFKGGILDRQSVFELLRQYKPELMTSSTEALSKPSPLFNRSGYGSRPGSIISAIMTPLRFHIPLGFLESNGLLAHLDNYLPAAATGEEDLVNLLLEHGATINAPGHPETEWSHPALAAIFAHNWDLALRFLDEFDRKWSMAFMVSLESDNPDVAFKLIQASFFILERAKGSDFDDMVETRSHLFDMGTPMHAACNELEARDEPTPGASSGDSLTAACSSGKVEAVEIFLKYGSDVNQCTPGRERCGEDNVVSILLSKGAQANISYPFENSAVDPSSLQTMVLSYGKSLHFSLLWKRMWDDGKITGSSILQAKPFFGNPFIAAVVGQGVDVNHKEKCGIYPTAMIATLDMKKSYRVSEPLRELGATEITATQMLNFSHPFRALIDGSFWGNMITLCVNQGADPNQVISGSFYGSALIAASALLRSDAMMHFLDHGCDVNAVVPDSPFGTPLIAVCAGPAHYPFQWSFRKEFNLKDPPSWSMVQYDLMELLVAKGADVNIAHNEFTPLIALVLCDCEEEYKIKGLNLLLENGADPDVALPQLGYNKITAGKQWSAISIAEQKGHERIRRILVGERETPEEL